jgi:hypothetical protein
LILFAATLVTLATPSPKPTATPLTISGFFRSYYFTRQNASNNSGGQVNQASLNNAVDLHAEYFLGNGWSLGGSYLYAQPFSGPCSVASAHAIGQPCVSQHPPNLNPDDTLPGFMLSTFPEAYVGYARSGFSGKVGDQLFDSPWALPSDSRIKPAAFQGGDFSYKLPSNWTFEAADMLQFQDRTSNTFQSSTMLTSHPAGAPGLPNNIYVAGGGSITTPGFSYARASFQPNWSDYALNAYYYGVSDIATMWWFDGRFPLSESAWKPVLSLQGGFEYNGGSSVIGKIASSAIGVRLAAAPSEHIALDVSIDQVPWRYDTIVLPAPIACDNPTYQISAGARVYPGTTFPYFLARNAGQCYTHPNGTTSIAYGGWASPYTDGYTSDPLYTTQMTTSMPNRRSPGFSWRAAVAYTFDNQRLVFAAADGWFNFGNQLVSQVTNEWTLDGSYRLNPVSSGRYKGVILRYRYAQRSETNTTYLGGLPLFKYNRAQLEFDF